MVEIMSNRTGRFCSKSKRSCPFGSYVGLILLSSSLSLFFKNNKNSAFGNPKFYQQHILSGNQNVTHRVQFNLTYFVDHLLPVIDHNSKHNCQLSDLKNFVV